MTETIWTEALKYLVPSLLSFLIGFMISQFNKFNGLMIIVKWTARRMIIDTCKFYIEQGFMTPQENAELEQMWEVYHKKLKLNSEGETYYNLAKALPIKLETEKNETK